MLKSGQSLTANFTVSNPSTGASVDADSLPTGTLYINGTASGASVTVTNITTGVYKAAVTLPSLSAGDVVEIRITAAVSSVIGDGIVFQGVADTKRVSDLQDLTAAQVNAECDTAIADAALATDADMKRALGLMQENMAIDNPTFDSNNNLLTARFRIYSDSASVGTDSDVLSTYNMTATFSGAGKVTTYKMVKA